VEGKTILVEIKPAKETKPPKRKNLKEAMTYMKNTSKWKYAKNYCDDRGWKFEIWTEKTLESFGVPGMKKRKKAPWKPFKRKKK
jgi:hypothetical protein